MADEAAIPRSIARRVIPPVVALCLGIGAALMIGEIALRLVGFRFQVAPESIEFGFPNPQQMQTLYRPDPDLFWVQQSYDKSMEALRTGAGIVYMGDSCTEFGRYDEALKSLVAERHPGSGFRAVNVGVGGWTSHQGAAQMRRDVAPTAPRVATIYFGWNDHWQAFGLSDSQIARMMGHGPLSRLRLAQLWRRVTLAQTDGMVLRVAMEDYRRNLQQMVRDARRAGTVPVLLTAPTSIQPGREPAHLATRWLEDLTELLPLHDSYNDVVREVAAAEDVPLCDLAAVFARLPTRDLVRVHFKNDGIHTREAGDALIARTLYETLEQQGLLSRILTPGQQSSIVGGRNFEGEVLPPIAEAPAPSTEPIEATIISATMREDGLLVVEGRIDQPDRIDAVALFTRNGESLGGAIFPVRIMGVGEWDGFYYERRFRGNAPALDTVELRVYTGDSVVTTTPVSGSR